VLLKLSQIPESSVYSGRRKRRPCHVGIQNEDDTTNPVEYQVEQHVVKAG
jgi:hypothetical protein